MLTKQPVAISFAQGVQTKVDPWQLPVGSFQSLVNSVFTTGNRLTKRNGYADLTALPATTYSYLTTLNSGLTALGTSIASYSASTTQWTTRGSYTPLKVDTLPLLRNSVNQTQADTAIAPNGLICTCYTEVNAGASSYKYVIADSLTGQNVIAPRAIPVSAGTVTGSPRAFLLGQYFVIVFTNVITATSHLQYIAISVNNPSVVTTAQDIASSYIATTTLSWDGVVTANRLFIAYNTTTGGQSIKVTSLTPPQAAGGVVPATPVTFAGQICTIMSLCADETNPASPTILVNYYDAAGRTSFTLAVNVNLSTVLAPTATTTTFSILNLASSSQNGVCTTYYEIDNPYSYDSIATNFIGGVNVTIATGAVATRGVLVRSVGLASKAFIVAGVPYFVAAYQSPYQPTYFVINAATSTAAAPIVIAKLAYQNGGGYLTTGLPSVTVTDTVAQFPYRFKDLIQAVNKNTNVTSGTQVAGIYSQTGINLASLDFTSTGLDTSESASDLHISGGFLWMYDGYLPVEHNFFLYPDSVEATWSATGGAIHAQPNGSTNTNAYYYQAVYEWSDNQGNIFRSAPSIPIAVTTTGNGTAGSITVNVPTLRLTYKTANPVKITIYRWSVAQESYYQVTSISSATLNSTTTDSIAFADTLADVTILGNELIYTTGNVAEDGNAPATNIMTLFDTRLWLVDAEDQNLLWFSKQIIEATPVEMSDLLTLFISPNAGTSGSTGPIRALAPMDDKLIIFKKNAIYYINGAGPDNTGANPQYSQPIFITSTIGCINQASLVLMDQGLMFQSDKGIWLLSRNLTTQYIGAPVEAFNAATVTSAVNVPETTQVRFTLSTGQTLMYDYFYQQWGLFEGVPAISSCTYENLHTFINSYGQVLQESPGQYLDGARPVQMSFTTGWLNLAGLQGYQRAYFFYLLGQYMSPHKLQVSIAYDYNPSPTQVTLIQPTNFAPAYGAPGPYGQGNPYGGPGTVEQWRVFLATQRCQAFQISLQEVFDPSLGIAAGAGLTLSGINAVVGVKKGYRPMPNSGSAGGGTNSGAS